MLKNDPKTIFGWCMYDWANSAYATTVAVGFLPIYFASVVVGEGGVSLGGSTYSATALWGFTVALASLIAFAVSPVLGAIADFTGAKKRFLLSFAYIGSLATLLFYLSESGDVWMTLGFFLLTQVCFIGANVFYDAFLPQITTDDKMDAVSGRGFSYGYVGGGIQLALAFGIVAMHEALGLSQTQAVRVGIASAGIWWAGFTIITARNLREAPTNNPLPREYLSWRFRRAAYVAVGFSRLLGTLRRAGKFKHLVLFLAAYMLYNEGIQTVISMAVIYGKEELRLTTTSLLATLLIIQIVAAFGAIFFSRIAGRIGTKRAITATLILWSGVVIYAYFITTAAQFFGAGVALGLVMGGSQALSRSFYGSMIPEKAAAEFYGFYTVFSKFSAIWGPLAFALIRQTTGSARNSIISLIAFFIAGVVLLYFVDEKKARSARESGEDW
ncbi:MAG: MFS transporter [Deltaproteobacteria bacterium]